jgi:dipeptidyl aminopeptidase/acylaminoacyl peptidase
MEAMPVWERRFRGTTPSFPTWSRHAPDRLVFASNEEGEYQVFAYHRGGPAPRRVSSVPIGVDDGMPSADGAEVIWFQDDRGDEQGRWVSAPFEGGGAEPLLDLEPGWPSGIALGLRTVVAGRSDHDGYAIHVSMDGGPTRELYRHVEAASVGGTANEIDRMGFNLGGLSSDERLVCIAHSERGNEVHKALRVLDVTGGEVVGEQWDGEGLGLHADAWSPVAGDQRLAITHERFDRGRPAIWDLGTGERTDLQVDLPGDVLPMDWWPDASALLVVHAFEGRDELYRLDIASGASSGTSSGTSSGALERVPHEAGTVLEARVRPDGDVWMHLSSGGSPPHTLSVRTGQEVVAIPDRPTPGVAFESWRFDNRDGVSIHGFVASPPGEGPFPTIMLVHGGPTWLSADAWDPEVQAYVDHGFAVGLVNYPGSTGYGRAWRDAIVGDIGREAHDIVAGLQDLVARGIADPDRSVIGGWSWGGYVTLLSVGIFPDRWRAAIGGVPVGDYEACYEQLSPDLQAYDRYLLGGHTPHEVPELMAERSPIVFADRVRTPTIVLAGRNDSRCPFDQAVAWVEAVRAAGGEVELYEYETGHVSFDVDEVVRQMRAILDFLALHVPAA